MSSPSKILGLAPGPPYDPATWSGSSLGLFGSLKALGHMGPAIGVKFSKRSRFLSRAVAFYPSQTRWRDRYRSSSLPSKFLSREARKIASSIAEADYNAILQLGPYIKSSNVPLVSYHDDELSMALATGWVTYEDSRRRLDYEGPYYRAMDRIFMMSNWAADGLASFHHVDREKIDVVGAGSNIGEDLLGGERDYDRAHFLFVGREFARKGGPDVLSAFEIVRKSIPHAKLTLVGVPDVGRLPLGVESIGFVRLSENGKERMAALYRSASAFVMPSKYEPFGIAFLEALAAGLPCIGADACAMPEIIGDAGYVVPPGDVRALARAMYDAVADPSHCAELGHRARERYNVQFGWSRVAAQIGSGIDRLRGF